MNEALVLDISVSNDLPFAKAGDECVLTYKPDENDKIVVTGFKLK